MNETVLITGGTGLVGKALTKLLISHGYEVTILTRNTSSPTLPGINYAYWNIPKREIDENAIKKADHIIHLAGAGVMDKKWTDEYKKEIVESRTLSSALLIKGIRENSNKIKTVISASAIGWYGADQKPVSNKTGFGESDLPDNGFLGETCKLWEESIEPVSAENIRLVKLRTGIVLSNDGGAFPEFKKSLKFGIAAILGSGKQVVSWIHINDLCRMFLFALENKSVLGPYNAVAPMSVSSKKLVLDTGKRLRGSFFVPIHVPKFVLKVMMGQRSIEVLKSTTVDSAKIQLAGFTFLYPAIDMALAELCSLKGYRSSV